MSSHDDADPNLLQPKHNHDHDHSHNHDLGIKHQHDDAMSSSCSVNDAGATGATSAASSWNIIKNPSNGRTRISQACDRCRARKIKCSGKSENSPKCTNCEKDGFPCIVSDKLTRNSFPKGYTKNLEKKLLDVELSRNQLLIEVNNLKQKLNSLDSANISNPNNHANDSNTVNNCMHNKDAGLNETINPGNLELDEVSSANRKVQSKQRRMTYNDARHMESSESSRREHYLYSKITTNDAGILKLDQNLKSPFETIFKSLNSNPFKGYKSNSSASASALKSNNSLPNVDSSSVSSAGNVSSTSDESLDPVTLKHLSNYHMNLNRYLNLILYKLIFPLFNLNSKNNSSTSTHDSNKNLDHLIWLFFNDYNKLIPILDFELFYNDYLTFVNSYTIKNSTYTDNGELKKRYYEFNEKDQDILIKLILILKFTLCQPKVDEHNLSSAFLPDKSSLNQLDESIKLINLKHLTMMFKNINFIVSPTLDKLEISLLLFYYLIKFENYNLPNYTDGMHSHKSFLLDIINLNKYLVLTLNINKSNNLLVFENKVNKRRLIEIQRLKLYWNFKVLIKLAEIYFNIPLIDEEFELNAIIRNEDEMDIDVDSIDNKNAGLSQKKILPASLESIVLVNKDIKITLCLVNLLQLIPWNIMTFVNENNLEVLQKLDSSLSNWKKSVEDLYNEENSVVFNKLKSYYLYFKVLVNINGTIDSSYFIDFVNLVYDLTFNNPKSTYKNHEISIEASESLCLHSFNFHLVTLISITSLQNIKDKTICQKIYKLIQLYQILINFKDVDPLISTFVTYIKDNILYSFSDVSTIHDDTLKLFSLNDAASNDEKTKSSSLFDKKLNTSRSSRSSVTGSTNSVNNFDLSAFNLPSDSHFSVNSVVPSTINKRRKSNASTSSVMSSNMSFTSKDSSLVSASGRLSVSSNDSVPSLFPSATSPFQNSNGSCYSFNSSNSNLNANNNSTLFTNDYAMNKSYSQSQVMSSSNANKNANSATSKRRIMEHSIQPIRTINRSRSLSADSRIRNVRNDRRLSGSNNGGSLFSRDNSSNNYLGASLKNNLEAESNGDSNPIVDEDIVSRILNSDIESEVDSDVGMIVSSRAGKSATFKLNTLPTIPSEGNLMKIMGSVGASLSQVDSAIKSEFDIDSLFSIGSQNHTPNTANDISNPTNSTLSPDSNANRAKVTDFSKAFKKLSSPNSISSSYINAELESNINMTNDKNNKLNLNSSANAETPLIDDDDLMRLKEHVMSMKTSIH